ncbi:MAG TPA: helix-turn-helix domain-containing protein [Nitrososphaera sp.]|nr:helix-turn-helix domain-containing protein [Nitrososphaera sp.]
MRRNNAPSTSPSELWAINTLLILRDIIYFKQNCFSQFLNSIEGINTKALTNRLEEMKQAGLIERRIFNEHPVKIEYYPTNKGLALKHLIDIMAGYSMTHYGKEVRMARRDLSPK